MSEKLIREWVQQLLREGEESGGDAPTAPDEIEITAEDTPDEILEPESSGLIEWADIIGEAQGDAQKHIQDVIDNGPVGDNDNGELGIIAALNILAGQEVFQQKGGSADYDIECLEDTTIRGEVFPAGKYEAKTQGKGSDGKPSGGKLARLGQAKAISVASQPSLAALKDVGTAYSRTIYGKFSDKNGALKGGDNGELAKLLKDSPGLLSTLIQAIEYFETPFTTSSSKGRWYSMMGLELAGGTVAQMRASLSDEISTLAGQLSTGLGEKPAGEESEEPPAVTVVSDEGSPDDPDDNVSFEFDKLTWSADISRVMKSRQQGSGLSPEEAEASAAEEKEELKKLTSALQDVWTAIDRSKADLDKLAKQEFWDDLAEETQGDSGVVGIFAVDDQRSNKEGPKSAGFRFFTFPNLTVTSITQGGRIVLAPKSSSKNESINMSNQNLIREYIREALLTEAFTKTDERAIETMARKEIDKKWKKEHEKKIDKMFDDRDKTLFRNDAFYKVIARIYQELQRAYAEDQFKYAARYTRKDIPLARFRPS